MKCNVTNCERHWLACLWRSVAYAIIPSCFVPDHAHISKMSMTCSTRLVLVDSSDHGQHTIDCDVSFRLVACVGEASQEASQQLATARPPAPESHIEVAACSMQRLLMQHAAYVHAHHVCLTCLAIELDIRSQRLLMQHAAYVDAHHACLTCLAIELDIRACCCPKQNQTEQHQKH